VCRKILARQRIEQHARIPYTHGLRSVYDEFTAAIHPRLGKQRLGKQRLGKQRLGKQRLGKQRLGKQRLGKQIFGGQKLGRPKPGKTVARCLGIHRTYREAAANVVV
jgi:hypothetical protein